MTVTLIGAHRNAWSYLYETVAAEHGADRSGDKASYYFSEGTPPGIWRGKGLASTRLTEGELAKEAHLARLFGEGKDPKSEEQLGKAFAEVEPLEKRINARAKQLPPTLTADELASEYDRIVQEELARKDKQSVAGFEFVFSPPKSVSAWWALADPSMKERIRDAHQAAITATIEKLETDIVRTRTGIDGVAQEHVKGIIAATFDHWDSREGDPQLHTHMLVSNRVQAADGKWRTIDSRWSLMPAVATAGAYYDSALMDELSNHFGVEWTTQDVQEHPEQYRKWLADGARVDTPATRHQFSIDQGINPGSVKWQIASIPYALTSEYSTRSKKVVSLKDQLIADYVRKHGRQPNASTIIKMRQTATLRTRTAKRSRSLSTLTASWRERAVTFVGDSFLFADRVAAAGKQRLNDLPLWSFRHDDVDDSAVRDAAEIVLHQLSTARSTWGKRNAETAALRTIMGWRFRSPADRDLAAKRITNLVLQQAIALTPRNPLRPPTAFQTADGEDMFHPEARDLYTTAEVWDAEERLLEAGRRRDGVRVDQSLTDSLISTPTGEEARILSDDQAHAVDIIVGSGRPVDVLVGPAGAGKTTSLEKLREIWETQHGAGSVRGLAPTARAAEVLAESLGIQTENTAKWLHETARGSTARDGFSYKLKPGDLMIIDEASIAGTLALDQLRAQTETAGAKLLLVGDWAQLAAVDAGGAFGLLANDREGVAELVNLHRFKADWEGEASKLLRLGKTSGLTPYINEKRISWGFDETIVHDAVEAWKLDEATPNEAGDATQVSLLIAPTNDMVERLNDIARTWRIEQGQVDATQEATIASGVASLGDRIVTRQNARTLRTDRDRWVKNNDEWVVVAIDDATGDIVAAAGEERVTLPAAYCRDNVQLAYATTAHRSQGRTVDTAHTIVDSSASRETFYVAMTRGKLSNKAYVVVDQEGIIGDSSARGMTTTWRDILERVVLTRGGDIAAHDTLSDEAVRVGSIRQLAAEHQTLVAHELERTYLPLLQEFDLIDPEQDSPCLGPVLANVRRLELTGQKPGEVITTLLEARELGSARDKLAILHHRLATHLESENLQVEKIAGLIEKSVHVDDPDMRAAIDAREHAMQLRAELVLDRAIEQQAAWLTALGEPNPSNPEEWRRRAVTVACYRDLYSVHGDDPLGREHAHAKNRQRDRQIAEVALRLPTPSRKEETATIPDMPISVSQLRGY